MSVVAILLVIAGFYYFSGSPEKNMEKDSMMSEKTEESAMMDKGGEAMGDKSETTMEKGEEAMMDKSSETMMKSGSYEAYSPEKLSLANGGKVMLFFHADWCPVCRSLEAEISSNEASIPADTHILKVDYDKEITLRQKYGVTVQHTFAQVDSSGNLIQKFSDAPKLSTVLSRIK